LYKFPALSTDANARQFCFSVRSCSQTLIRHRRYIVAAYLAELAPVPADDRATAAALAHARDINAKPRTTSRQTAGLSVGKNLGMFWVQWLSRYAQLAHLESPALGKDRLFSVRLGFDSHLPPHQINGLAHCAITLRRAKPTTFDCVCVISARQPVPRTPKRLPHLSHGKGSKYRTQAGLSGVGGF
jgi:hypothetical protein